MIYVCAPHYKTEDLTGDIAEEIAKEAGVEFVTGTVDNAMFVLEIGGIEDKVIDGSIPDLLVDDKTHTQIFKTIFDRIFNIRKTTFNTALSNTFDRRYARLELTNKVRYSEKHRKLLVKTAAEILREIKKLF